MKTPKVTVKTNVVSEIAKSLALDFEVCFLPEKYPGTESVDICVRTVALGRPILRSQAVRIKATSIFEYGPDQCLAAAVEKTRELLKGDLGL